MKVIKKSVEYAGVSGPGTPEELEIEIFGLKNAIRQAQELISRHEQAIALVRLARRTETIDAVTTGQRPDAGTQGDSPTPAEVEG